MSEFKIWTRLCYCYNILNTSQTSIPGVRERPRFLSPFILATYFYRYWRESPSCMFSKLCKNNMDPWLTCQRDVTFPEIPITKFEDNFTSTISDKLPDSEEYLAILEAKLRKLKNTPTVIAQLAAKKEACMQQLLSSTVHVEQEIIELEEPVTNLQILRAIAPQKQALNQGEIVALVKYDQLKDDESDSEVNKDSSENNTP